MKIKYQLTLQTEKFKKTTIFEENSSVRIGSVAECQVLLPGGDSGTGREAELVVLKKQVQIRCVEGLCLGNGVEQAIFTLPARFELCEKGSGMKLVLATVETVFEKPVPEYSVACELPQGRWIRIGGAAECDVHIKDYKIGDDCVSLLRSSTGVQLRIDKAQYGASVNGKVVTGLCDLDGSSFFSLDGYEFYYDSGYLYMDSHAKLSYSPGWKTIDNRLSTNQLKYPRFNKGPRFVERIDETEITILDPSAKREAQKTDLLVRILPTLVMLLVTVLLRGVMGGGGLYIVISATSMGVGIFTSIYTHFKNKKDIKEANLLRIEQYESYIDRKVKEIEQARAQERDALRRIYRTPQQGIEAIWAFSELLFDRSPGDEDFLKVYLGSGMQPARRKVTHQKRETITLDDELMQRPEVLCETYRNIMDVPIVSDLRSSNAVGIVGADHRLKDMLYNITIDLCTRHSDRDLQLFFIMGEGNTDWLRWLPHVQNRELGVRNIVSGEESRTALFEYLYSMLAKREQTKASAPHNVVFVQNAEQLKKHPLSKYLDRCASLGVTFIFMENHHEFLPENCDEVIELENDITTGTLRRRADAAVSWRFSYGLIDGRTAQRAALRLSPIYCEEVSVETSLPTGYSLFDAYEISSVEELKQGTIWEQADVSKSLAAPVGINARGEVVFLDIHEKAHGPHGLVAGTTGSGKSEFLQSYMAAMSVNYSPYEVAFLIIDFKGGGMANQMKHLPHLVGTITNIDGAEIARSLKSIKAELQKRQKLFDQAGVNHIDKYISRYKQKKAVVPLPHLIIVVDEFAELKAAQPEFMDELISAARIGRSLGIHLILATQKPAGQVNDQIWSNSRFRMCFKVQNREDSNEMLRSPLAAEIKEPGRGYLQVGNDEMFELFQSAYSGGSVKNESKETVEDFTLAEVSLWGERKVVYNSAWGRESGTKDEQTQLSAVIGVVDSYCKRVGIKPLPGICLPSLPEQLEAKAEARQDVQKGIIACLGRYDDPEQQRQEDIRINLTNGNLMLIGSSQMGKTTALQTLIRSLSERYDSSEVNLYILDFASMILKNFERMDHVGGVAVSSEQEKVQNLFRMLLEEMEARKKALLSSGVSSFASYLEMGKRDLPQIILVLDNFTNFRELYEGESEQLLKLCREGLAVGIAVVIANAQTSGLGYRYMANFANRLAFFCHDSGEYSSLFDYCRMSVRSIPGRGMIKMENRIREFQGYLGFSGEREIDSVNAIKGYIKQANQRNTAKPARKIPIVPELITRSGLKEEMPALFEQAYRVPIGMNYTTMSIECIDLLTVGAFGICGRDGMGKTNLLMHMLRTLEENMSQGETEVYIVDDLRRRLQLAEQFSCVQLYTTSAETAVAAAEMIYEELQRRKAEVQNSGLTVMEAVGQMPLKLLVFSGQDAVKAVAAKAAVQDKLMEIVKELDIYKAAVIVTGIENTNVPYSGPAVLKHLKECRSILLFEDVANFKFVDASLKETRTFEKPIRQGDAYGYFGGQLGKIRTILA